MPKLEKQEIFFTSSTATAAALWAWSRNARLSTRHPLSARAMRISRLPQITVRRLLKSCAKPPAIQLIASICLISRTASSEFPLLLFGKELTGDITENTDGKGRGLLPDRDKGDGQDILPDPQWLLLTDLQPPHAASGELVPDPGKDVLPVFFPRATLKTAGRSSPPCGDQAWPWRPC